MKIVRVKETTNYSKGDLVEIYLTTEKEYLIKSSYTGYGGTYKIYPYKWYDLRRFIKYPVYYLSSLWRRMKVSTPPHKAQKIITDILIGLFVTVVGSIISYLIIKHI